MVKRDDIVKFCDNYLKVEDFHDFCYNGLQIEGSDNVDMVIVGVSLSQQLIERSIQENAQMIIVHHGLFKNQLGDPPRIFGIFKKRIKTILENDINLCGYHLPLDAHSEIGNNIVLCNMLDLKNLEPLASPYYGDIGYVGELKKPILFLDFVDIVNNTIHTDAKVISAGSNKVRKVGIISGGSSSDYLAAYEAGADTFITGDVKENIVREVEELGINFVNAGHYNTEKYGIQKLGEVLRNKFTISVHFVDIPNEI